VRECCVCSPAKDNLCTGSLSQFAMPADKVGLKMCLKDGDDLQSIRLSLLNVLIYVPLRVYNDRLSF